MASATAATRAGKTRANLIRFGAIVASLFLVSILIMNESRAAFTATTSNTSPDAFAAGTVTLTDNDGGSALFNVTNAKPGDSTSGCIKVSYTGSIDPQEVRVYRNAFEESQADFGSELNLVIQEGTNTASDFNDCSGFSGTTIYSGTLAGLATGYSGDVGAWDPSGAADKWYKFTLTLDSGVSNTYQGATITNLIFTWETTS